MVHGRARAISVDTGVGKADSDGPKSAMATRRQKFTYCSSGPPVSLYSSRSEPRIRAIASGEVLPKKVTAAIDCSTGSIGVAWVMTYVRLMPINTTSRHWVSRWARYLASERIGAAGWGLVWEVLAASRRRRNRGRAPSARGHPRP